VELYPAIDVRGGRVARARPGALPRDADDPISLAREFARAGARWLHVVDLDRAFGQGDNRALAERLLAAAPVSVQVGGGLGTARAVEEMLDWGAARVVIGGRAAADAGLVARLIERHGPARLAVGIDAKGGRVAPRGTTDVLAMSSLALGHELRSRGARTVIYTDVERDGTLAGPDLDGARALAALGLDVIASGGIAALEDLRQVKGAGLAGAIVGRALYDGRFTLAEALACVDA
jgi:phosphoribosylformimino-5-aminoimidazole carboxamide ribotide isomerase